ncbi:MAG: hypothetical protein K0R14_446 [Burkholderiales bacterium]|jgi:hypothetical protein|nr:hypothetical protein [Burkholderiales bacterium]
MKALLNLCFITVMLFSGFSCFADQEAERLALLNGILKPALENFSRKDLVSTAKFRSSKIIELQKERVKNGEKPLTRAEYLAYIEQHCKDSTDYEQICETFKELASKITFEKKDRRTITATGLANSQLYGWEHKAANCGEFADLALIIFEFNQINTPPEQQLFNDAMLIGAIEPYDHAALLVKGKSRTLYVVDLAFRRLMKLSPKVSSELIGIIDTQEDNFQEGAVTTEEFANALNPYLKIEDYYDQIYVNSDTQWYVDLKYSKRIKNFVHEYNPDMKRFYTKLQATSKFPALTKPYDELPLEGKPSPTDSKEE